MKQWCHYSDNQANAAWFLSRRAHMLAQQSTSVKTSTLLSLASQPLLQSNPAAPTAQPQASKCEPLKKF